MNYLDARTMQRARVRAGWLQCCQPRNNGGLELMNPEDAMIALMAKWVVKAMEPGNSNLHLLLRYRLSMYQPFSGGRWCPSLEYFTLPKNQCHKGSAVWNRTTTAWKTMAKEITYNRPNNLEELLSCSIWLCRSHPVIRPGFSKVRAAALHKKGMRHYRDIWRQTRFLEPLETQAEFGLQIQDFGAWVAMTQDMGRQWADILKDQSPRVGYGEWIGIFESPTNDTPVVACLTSDNFQPCLGYYNVEIPAKIHPLMQHYLNLAQFQKKQGG